MGKYYNGFGWQWFGCYAVKCFLHCSPKTTSVEVLLFFLLLKPFHVIHNTKVIDLSTPEVCVLVLRIIGGVIETLNNKNIKDEVPCIIKISKELNFHFYVKK